MKYIFCYVAQYSLIKMYFAQLKCFYFVTNSGEKRCFTPSNYCFFLKKIFFYLFLERGEGKEKERETSMCGCLSSAPHWGPGLYNPGMCPTWESNWQPFGLQARTQSTELHQPGLVSF